MSAVVDWRVSGCVAVEGNGFSALSNSSSPFLAGALSGSIANIRLRQARRSSGVFATSDIHSSAVTLLPYWTSIRVSMTRASSRRPALIVAMASDRVGICGIRVTVVYTR